MRILLTTVGIVLFFFISSCKDNTTPDNNTTTAQQYALILSPTSLGNSNNILIKKLATDGSGNNTTLFRADNFGNVSDIINGNCYVTSNNDTVSRITRINVNDSRTQVIKEFRRNSTGDRIESRGCGVSKNGNKIYYTTENDDSPIEFLYAANPDGSNEVMLDDSVSNNPPPQLSPNGTKIAYFAGEYFGGKTELRIMDLTTKQYTVYPDAQTQSNGFGTIEWSSDGTKLIVGSGGGDLYIINVATSTATSINTSSTSLLTGFWGHDNSYIVATSFVSTDTSLKTQLVRMKVDGTGMTTIVASPSDRAYVRPRVSKDGKSLLFHSVKIGGPNGLIIEDSKPMIMDMNTMKITPLLPQTNEFSYFGYLIE
jgi:Tol biopolymer transport system component